VLAEHQPRGGPYRPAVILATSRRELRRGTPGRPDQGQRPPRQQARTAREGNRRHTWLVMPIYPSGHGAAALTGAQSSAPRASRRATRCQVKGQRRRQLSGAGRQVRSPGPAPSIVSIARNPSREPALTEPGRPGQPAAPPTARRPRRPSQPGAPGAPQAPRQATRRRSALDASRTAPGQSNAGPGDTPPTSRPPGQKDQVKTGTAVSISQDKVSKPRRTEPDVTVYNRTHLQANGNVESPV